MGAVCGQPLDNGEVEYYGPPDRPRTVPNDLRVWKEALADRERQKRKGDEQPQQEPQQQPQSVTSSTGASMAKGGGTTSSSSAPVPVGDVLLTPGGTKIGKLKDGEEERGKSQALAVI